MLFSNKFVKITISSIAAIVVFAVIIYSSLYAYWGRRHKVLYKVDEVYMTQIKDGYEFKIVASAKNWATDNNTYNYFLMSDVSGMPDYWWDGYSDYISVSNNASMAFEINGVLKTESVDEEIVKDEMLSTRFSPCEGSREAPVYNNGLENATLYMQDYENVEFIFH